MECGDKAAFHNYRQLEIALIIDDVQVIQLVMRSDQRGLPVTPSASSPSPIATNTRRLLLLPFAASRPLSRECSAITGVCLRFAQAYFEEKRKGSHLPGGSRRRWLVKYSVMNKNNDSRLRGTLCRSRCLSPEEDPVIGMELAQIRACPQVIALAGGAE